MKKIFSYISNIWIGPDGKPSVKRLIAISFSIHIIYFSTAALYAYLIAVKNSVYKPEVILAAQSALSSIVGVISIEAGLITAMLGIAAYTGLQQGK